jgi:UDP-N-acetyl-alpha-D-muramoyl-L-alanyl-L-glutamate epimerase
MFTAYVSLTFALCNCYFCISFNSGKGKQILYHFCMQQQQNQYEELRKGYPYFVYEGYHIHYVANTLQVKFSFNLAGKIKFEPQFSIELKSFTNRNLPDALLHNLVFHIGMVEMISYWKACCSPQIIIKPFYLEPNALAWWKRLYFNGLGEFFHINGIKPDYNDFLTFECEPASRPEKHSIDLTDSSIVPIGGGKDSVVTLEILRSAKKPLIPFFLNPTKAALEVARVAGFEEDQTIIIKRNIDPELLLLNDQGFLNGHTPFSALLAFYSLIPAILSGSKNIVLSNESSANEPTIYGTEINHQYSKSYDFEKDFREYCTKYISDNFNYFSFLRPLNELQIAALFSGFQKYHPVFRSCNAGSKTDIWCGKCPKCLFTFIILSPFLEPAELVGIFGSNLLDDPDLSFYFDQLCGLEEEKPFDCIGTIDEVNAALHAAINKYRDENIPVLLQRYKQSLNCNTDNDNSFRDLLTQFNTRHFIPDQFLQTLKIHLNERIS